jgi:hypothetical protein
VVGACGVVVSTPGCVGKSKVGVVYELEFAGSFGTFWGIGWDAVGVGLECCSGKMLVVALWGDRGEGKVPFVGISDLLSCGCGRNSKCCVWKDVSMLARSRLTRLHLQ